VIKLSSALELSSIELSPFLRCFGNLPDTRDPVRMRYSMPEVLFLVISSIVSGYESNRGIAEFGHLKLDWLRRYFPYNNSIPHHETIGNIIGLIDKKTFEFAFIDWVSMQFGPETVELIHIDGKRLRSSANKEEQYRSPTQGGKNAHLILNAYASGVNLVVAQIDVSESKDEKEGAKRLIEQLHLKGKTITGDGNFCVKEILKLIRRKHGHYLMTLKGNQPALLDHVKDYFGNVLIDKMMHYTEDNGHGRIERRTYQMIDVRLSPHIKLQEYKDLCKVIKVRRQRKEVRTNKESDETHYYITSLDEKVPMLADKIRNHWSIENNLHWVLDVEFKEDASRKRTANQAVNFSLMRKVALNMINRNRGKKSIKAIRMACALSDEIRENTLGFS